MEEAKINENLILVVTSKDWEIAKNLINKGADVNQLIEEKPILHHAVFSREIDFVKFLLEKGAKVNVVDSKGNTALVEAIFNENEKAIDIFLEAEVDVNIGRNHEKPLLLAVGLDDWELAKN